MIRLLLLSLILASCSSVKIPLEKIEKKEKHFTLSWVKDLDPEYNTGNLPVGNSSPFIFEDILYMGTLNGDMRAYDVESGKVLWEVKEKAPIQSQVNKLGENIFYGTQAGRLIVRHYLTGKLKYATDLGSPIETQVSFVNKRAVIHLRNHSIITLDAQTGKIFWRYKRSVPYLTTLQRVSRVLGYNNSLIVGFADGYLVSLSVEEGVVNWEQKLSTGLKFVDVDVRPVLFNGLIIAGSAAGPMRMINPSNGVIEKTVEIFQSHTPLILKDHIVVGSVFGDLYKIDKYAKIVSRKKISKNGISSIAKWKNGIVVTTMGSKVSLLSLDNFKTLDNFELGHDQSAVFGQSVTGENVLGLYSSRNRLYLFK